MKLSQSVWSRMKTFLDLCMCKVFEKIKSTVKRLCCARINSSVFVHSIMLLKTVEKGNFVYVSTPVFVWVISSSI